MLSTIRNRTQDEKDCHLNPGEYLLHRGRKNKSRTNDYTSTTLLFHTELLFIQGNLQIPKRDLHFTFQPCPLATGPMQPWLSAPVLSDARLLPRLWGGWAGVSCWLCFRPGFGDYAFDRKASDVSEMLPLVIHSSLVASASFGFLGPCFQFIFVSRATKSHS